MTHATTLAPEVRKERTRQRGLAHAIVSFLRLHWAVSLVTAAYVGAAAILPTRADLVMYDDFVYIRQAQEFARHLVIHVPNETAANTVFEILWGGTFGAVFGAQHLWVYRLATLVLSLLGGLALYALCRELEVGRKWSACGAALFLFNPLYFVLSYSFMTDPHLVALVVIATYGYVRGLRSPNRIRWTIAGSTVASLAYLSRPQGALLPAAMVAWMFLARRVRLDRRSLVEIARVAAVPAVVFFGHQAWLRLFNGVPKDQAGFAQSFFDLGARNVGLLVGRLTFVELMYLGLFLLPVAIGAARALRTAAREMTQAAWLAMTALTSVIVVGFLFFQSSSRRMPYIQSWFTTSGLGPDSIVSARGEIMQPWMLNLVTLSAFLGAIVIGLFVCRALFDRSTAKKPEAFLLVVLTVAMAVGAAFPSAEFFSLTSLDRYILPLLPFVIVLAVWACNGLPVWRYTIVAGLVAMGAFSVIATHDNLEFHSAIWKLDRYARSRGIPNSKLDGGAGWTRYQLAEPGPKVKPYPGAIAEWWVTSDSRTTAQYSVSGAPLVGRETLRGLTYSQWLQTGPSRIYLQKLPDNR